MTKILFTSILTAVALTACASVPQVNKELAQLDTDAKLIGVLVPKSVAESCNDLTIGCETLDRDYADYHKYKEDLEQLGIKKIRLMAGWAKTEKEKGGRLVLLFLYRYPTKVATLILAVVEKLLIPKGIVEIIPRDAKLLASVGKPSPYLDRPSVDVVVHLDIREQTLIAPPQCFVKGIVLRVRYPPEIAEPIVRPVAVDVIHLYLPSTPFLDECRQHDTMNPDLLTVNLHDAVSVHIPELMQDSFPYDSRVRSPGCTNPSQIRSLHDS